MEFEFLNLSEFLFVLSGSSSTFDFFDCAQAKVPSRLRLVHLRWQMKTFKLAKFFSCDPDPDFRIWSSENESKMKYTEIKRTCICFGRS